MFSLSSNILKYNRFEYSPLTNKFGVRRLFRREVLMVEERREGRGWRESFKIFSRYIQTKKYPHALVSSDEALQYEISVALITQYCQKLGAEMLC